ncbi:MAG TPA: hypothetical protein PK131_01195 [Candidatus Woesebacteria bacterium]|nr:hypothetical protein [Candidatus Woesebacteria bacterium]HRT40223.1 hypothetical protein [Candidatus Woesebacteria bacterium]
MSVSLLPSQAKFQLAKTKLKNQLLILMVTLTGIWLTASILIWGWWLVRQRQLKVIQTAYNQVAAEYKNRGEDLLTSHRLKYQAKMVGKVLAARFEYGEAITNVNNLLPSEITISDFKIQGHNAFQINYTTNKGENMDIVEEKVAEINNKKVKGFTAAKLTSLSWESGQWKFSLEVKTE